MNTVLEPTLMEKINAEDQECIICGEKADVFWPIIDPDIESHPYCDDCVEKEKLKIMLAIYLPEEEKKNKTKN